MYVLYVLWCTVRTVVYCMYGGLLYAWWCTVHMVVYMLLCTVHLHYEHFFFRECLSVFVLFCNFPQKPELSGMFDVIDDLDFYLYPLENDLMTLAMDSAFSVSPSHLAV